jgi:hypothetical protein
MNTPIGQTRPPAAAGDRTPAQREPFPAFVVDWRWNLLRANRGAAKLVEFLTAPGRLRPLIPSRSTSVLP